MNKKTVSLQATVAIAGGGFSEYYPMNMFCAVISDDNRLLMFGNVTPKKVHNWMILQ